jgi:large subunit ribosomal protein L24
VVVTKGKDRGKRGKVLRIVGDRVIVEKINMIKRHTKASHRTRRAASSRRKARSHRERAALDDKLGRGTRTKTSRERRPRSGSASRPEPFPPMGIVIT